MNSPPSSNPNMATLASSDFPSLLLTILFLLSLSHHPSFAGKCHPDDEKGLLGFKSGITQDPTGLLSTWKPNTDCCKWDGITCLTSNRVTAISIYGQKNNPKSFISGMISPTLSNLYFLDGLYLVDLKNLTGPFPSFLFSLPNLLFVYIENGKLSGQLPADLGYRLPKIYAFSFSNNRFSGQIPTSITNLTGLNQLLLDRNLFSGAVPTGIRSVKNLTYLNLEHNGFSGKLPDFSGFSKLSILRLSHNRFSGEIPETLSTLAPNLRFLELGQNLLTGKIPSFLGNFQALDTLDLSGNGFFGTVPASFKNLTKIFNLHLSGNHLVDPFPAMQVKGIESLDLSHNHFHLGKIPDWVASSPIIYSLRLRGCGIKMDLKDWNPVETYFYDYIDLSGNEISGSPVGLLNRTGYLIQLGLAGNQLRFNLSDLKMPETLKYLDLSRNSIYGGVPNSISQLKSVNVSHNHLCGRIPATKFPASAFEGNDCLCGSPLPPCKK